jgi:gamma-glutamyltranspeptidase/glutathione hydrolase/leukotriene-C4 hydrolase
MYDLPEWSDVFVNPDTGVLLQAGETVRRPAYAETLRAIAAGGADAFYHGPVAQALVAKVQNAGGILTLRDLAEYRVEEREALQGRWGERTVYTAPAPACGGPLLTLLNVAALYPQWKRDGADDGLSAHRFVEASKFAFAQRTHIGDPAFLNASSLRVVAQIPSMHEAQRIRGRIDDDRTHRLEYYEPLFDITDDHGTQVSRRAPARTRRPHADCPLAAPQHRRHERPGCGADEHRQPHLWQRCPRPSHGRDPQRRGELSAARRRRTC